MDVRETRECYKVPFESTLVLRLAGAKRLESDDVRAMTERNPSQRIVLLETSFARAYIQLFAYRVESNFKHNWSKNCDEFRPNFERITPLP